MKKEIKEMYRGQRWRIELVRDKLKKQLDAKNDGQVIYTLQELTRTDPEEVKEILQPLAPDFAAWFKRSVIDKNSPSAGIEDLRWLFTYTDLWPEVLDAIEECKPQLVRFLLKGIRADRHESVRQQIKQLKAVGVDWPEFKVITNSLMENDDLGEGMKMLSNILVGEITKKHRGEIYAMYHMDSWKLNVKDFPEVMALIEQRKADIMRGILAPFADQSVRYMDAVQSAMFNVNRMRKIGIEWPELDVIEASVSKKKIKEAVARGHSPEETIMRNFQYSMLFGLRYMHVYDRTVADMPEASRIINRHKDATLKKLLTYFKQEDPDQLNELLGLLRSAGVKWKELDVIEKSFQDEYAPDQLAPGEPFMEDDEDDTDAERENFSYGNAWRKRIEWQEYMRELRDDIQNKSWDLVPLTLVDIGMTEIEDVLPERTMQMLHANREEIIRAMLEEIKISKWPEKLLYAIAALNNVGINWPELDIMHKSLSSMEKK